MFQERKDEEKDEKEEKKVRKRKGKKVAEEVVVLDEELRRIADEFEEDSVED